MGRPAAGHAGEVTSPVAPAASSAQRALDRLSEGVYSLSPDATIEQVNEAGEELAGVRRDDIVGRSLWEVSPHLARGRFREHLELARTTGQVVEFEDAAPHIGRPLRRRFYPSPDGTTVVVGAPSSSMLTGDERTELSYSLVRARETEQRYRDILDGVAEGVSETTPQGEFLVVNDSLARILGYDDPADLLAHVSNASELYATPSRRSSTVSRVSERGATVVEVEMVRRDGSHVWVRARLSAIRSADGQVTSLQGVIEDITEERESEQRRREAEERIETRERTLLAEAVHDDPLQLIVAALLRLDGLQAQIGGEHAEPVEHIAALLEQSVDRLRNLIVALSPPDLGSGLGVALRVLADGIFMGTSTTIEVAGPQHVPLTPEVKAVAYRVLREALVNARKHAGATRVRIGLEVDDASVTLSVADDGVGGARATSDPGHLGMTSMWSRAEALDATLRVDSPPGRGTTVELVVPRPTG